MSEPVSSHHYPLSALSADYGRAAVGVALLGLPIIMADLSPIILYILLLLALLFLAYGIRTAFRQNTRVTVDRDGIAVSGLTRKIIPWAELRGVDLRYYSTKRDKSDGWMELRIFGDHGKIKLESTLTDFEAVVRSVARQAGDHDVEISQASRTNMAAMGIRDADGAGPQPPGGDQGMAPGQ